MCCWLSEVLGLWQRGLELNTPIRKSFYQDYWTSIRYLKKRLGTVFANRRVDFLNNRLIWKFKFCSYYRDANIWAVTEDFPQELCLIPPKRRRCLANRALWETLRTSVMQAALKGLKCKNKELLLETRSLFQCLVDFSQCLNNLKENEMSFWKI